MRRAEREVHLLPEEFQFQKSASVFPVSSRDSVKDFPAMGPARREGSGMVLTALASRTAMESQEATRWLWSRGVHRGCPASGTARPWCSVNARGIGASLSAFFFFSPPLFFPHFPLPSAARGGSLRGAGSPALPRLLKAGGRGLAAGFASSRSRLGRVHVCRLSALLSSVS